MKIASIALLVREYDEAIEFYCSKLNFKLIEDTNMGEGKRWVVVSPGDAHGCTLLLARATKAEQKAAIGNQTGGRVFLFLHIANFWTYYDQLKSKGVEFMEDPREEEYGTVVVFKDLYGNKWDLIEQK